MTDEQRNLFNRMAYRLAKQVAGEHGRYDNNTAREILVRVIEIAPDALHEDVRAKIDKALEATT